MKYLINLAASSMMNNYIFAMLKTFTEGVPQCERVCPVWEGVPSVGGCA